MLDVEEVGQFSGFLVLSDEEKPVFLGSLRPVYISSRRSFML
jgi:hypothetical protein